MEYTELNSNQNHNNCIVITDNNTLITTLSSSQVKYLVCDVNGKSAALPIFKTTDLLLNKPDFLILNSDINITHSTIIDEATAYDAGIALSIYEDYNSTSKVLYNISLPLYKINSTDTTEPSIQFTTPTLVSDLSAVKNNQEEFQFLIVNINKESWGIPIQNFGSVFTSKGPLLSEQVDQQDIVITTKIEINPTKWNASRVAGSTTLNSKIKTYSDLINRVKMHLGWPVVQLEVCDEQIIDHIDMSIEWFTKYAGYTEEFLVFDSNFYKKGFGIKMDDVISRLYNMANPSNRLPKNESDKTELQKSFVDYDLDTYRKVVDVWSFDEAGQQQSDYLFSLEYVFAQQTYFSYVLGNYGFDLVTWHVLKDWIDTREKMFALRRRYYFDERNQVLRLTPEPMEQRFVGIMGAYVEKPIKDLIMERWIFQYALALTKITLGNIRGKFGQVSMFGGGTINYNDILSQGLEEKKQLESELLEKHGEVAPYKFFVG